MAKKVLKEVEEVDAMEDMEDDSDFDFDYGGKTKMPKKNKKGSPMSTVMTIVLAIVLGVATGYGVNAMTSSSGSNVTSGVADQTDITVDSNEIKEGESYGSSDTERFADSAVGYLKEGGFEGEGSHRLLREGGETQTIYLTSSFIDLDPFIGHEIEIWGETFAAQNVSWLMDVGGVKVVELDAEPPFKEESDEDEESLGASGEADLLDDTNE